MPCSESPLDDRMLRKLSATLPWVAPRISSKKPLKGVGGEGREVHRQAQLASHI